MSRTKIVISSFFYDLIGTGLLQVITFVITPVYLGYTSSELYGYWLTIGSVLGWLYLSDFGIHMALSRAVIAAKEANDEKLQSSLIRTAFTLYLLISFLFLGVGLSLLGLFIGWFKLSPETVTEFRITYIITVATAAIALPLSVFSAILEAFQKAPFNRLITFFSSLFGVGVVVLFLHLGFGLVAFPLGMTATILSSAIASWIYYSQQESSVSMFPLYLNKSAFRKLISFGGYFQLGKLANVVALNTDNIIIASYLGATFASVYTFSSKLTLIFSVVVISKISTALFPGISQLVDQGENQKLENIFSSLLSICIRIGIMSSGFVFISNEIFVTAWVGSDYFGGFGLNCVLVYLILLDCIYRGTATFVFSLGDLKYWSLISLLEAILNIGISVILVDDFGLFGVALGTAISRTLTSGIYTPIFMIRKLNVNWILLLKNRVLPTVLRSVCAMVMVYFISIIDLSFMNKWAWLFLIGTVIVLTNALFFEIPQLVRRNKGSLKERILSLKSDY